MTSPRVAELSLAAGDMVHRALALELDGSVESLAFVDHYLSTVGAVDEPVLRLVASAIGAYFGELTVSHLGAVWHAEADEPAEWIITLQAVPLSFRPVALAAAAIRRERGDDPDDEADPALTTLPALREPLLEALSQVNPVEEAYYYSLTGRYETIVHTADLLAAILVQRGRSGRDPAANATDGPPAVRLAKSEAGRKPRGPGSRKGGPLH